MAFTRRQKSITVLLDQNVYKDSSLEPVANSVNQDHFGLFEVSAAPVNAIDMSFVEIKHNNTKVMVSPSKDGKSLVVTVVKRDGTREQKVCELLL